MLIVKEKTPEIYHLKFKTSDGLALHLLRFSDYYEHLNEKIYRQKFSLSESLEYGYRQGKDWMAQTSGINLPISIIYRLAKEYGATLTVEEKFILSLIDTIKNAQPALKYLIGTYGDEDDADDLLHELAHGFYYTNQAYQLKMSALIRTLPKRVKKILYDYLITLNYHPSVHDDELQAYMATGIEEDDNRVINVRLISRFRAKFVDIFLETLSESGLI